MSDKALNLEDLRRSAKRRLPKIVFDFVEGGVEDEKCLARNSAAFDRYTLVPRYLLDVSHRSQSIELFGRRFDAPFGVSPMGLAGLAHPGVDLLLAQVAKEENLPYLMSNASNASIEDAVRIAGKNAWFQIYATADERINTDLVRRARALQIETLVVTVDVPVNSNRERNRRNGFSRPPKMTPSVVLDAMMHPRWVMNFLRTGGIPMMENWQPYAAQGASADVVADMYGSLTPAPEMTWAKVEAIQAAWPGHLVLKGILSPSDAARAAEMGIDGIIVSNHGGRQLDAAPAPLDVFPAIKAAVGDRVALILESGVRRGSDVVKAAALGAKLCLFGRPWLYGAASGGVVGVRQVAQIMKREIDLVLGQIGCVGLGEVSSRAAETVPATQRKMLSMPTREPAN